MNKEAKVADALPTEQKVFSEPTLRRLPLYHHYLKQLMADGVTSTSCPQIALALNLNPIQVKKDLECTALTGKPKVGYSVDELAGAIENFLGWNNTAEAFLIGAGHLGAALLGYQGFKDYGLDIIAAFDVDPAKIGTTINGKKIFPLKKFPELARRMGIKIGILTVPSAQAQELANLMVESGITAIWNFAPARISMPAGIAVQHENLASSLAVLSKKINKNNTEEFGHGQ